MTLPQEEEGLKEIAGDIVVSLFQNLLRVIVPGTETDHLHFFRQIDISSGAVLLNDRG